MRGYQFGLASFVAAALLLAACSDGATVTVSQPQQSGISVTGNGSVTVVPDIAVLNLGVEVTAKTVAEARTQAAEAMAAVLQTLTDNAIANADITTTSFSIQPQYDFRSEDTPQVIGYTVSNRLSVKVRNIDSVSDVLDDAAEAGGDAVRINGISFTVDQPEQFQDEARRLAMEDARERAEQLASLAGVKLGKPRTISESGFSVPFAGGAPAPVFSAARAETSISVGETEISLSVFVTYEIE
jgi:uncharacterized protein YggE